MKNIARNFIGLVVITIVSCTTRPDAAEIRMKHRVIIQQTRQNSDRVNFMVEQAGRSLRPETQEGLREIKKIESWRDTHTREESISSLISYADSIVNRYIKIPAKDEQVVAAIRGYRNQLIKEDDSTIVLNLYWYSLHAEAALMDKLLLDTGISGPHWDNMCPTNVNDTTFRPGDTVLILVNTFPELEGWPINFDSVQCINQQTQHSISSTVTKLDHYYLFRFIPQEKGKYLFQGPVSFSSGNYSSQLQVSSGFTVE